MTLVVIAVNPNKNSELKTEAERLVTLLSLAKQEAILLSKEFAVELTHDGYSFLAITDQQWTPIEDNIFRARNLPQDLYMDVYLEGEKYDFINAEEDEPSPRIYLFSSGEITPFEIVLQGEETTKTYHVSGDISGKLSMEEQE